MVKLVVGLGNPGSEYKLTRHNVGFEVVQRLADLASSSFSYDSLGPVELARANRLVLIKPLTYMNESGRAVREWLNWLKQPVEDLVVVVDDVALPLGEIRFRRSGSSGGHNGLRSIEENLGTDRYARLRCGIGPIQERWTLHDFVLARFEKEELARVEKMVERSAEAIQYCQREGIEVAMNRFNGFNGLESTKEEQ